jgi:hypothetical protein
LLGSQSSKGVIPMEQLDLKLKLFAGLPIMAEGYGEIAPLKVRDIIQFGYTDYMKCLNLISVELKDFVQDTSQLEDENISVLDFLMVFGGEEIEIHLEKALSLFLGGEAIIDKEHLQVLIKKEDGIHVVNRNNYANIQEVIKWQNYINSFEEKSLDGFDPANEEARKFKERIEKLKKQREEIKRKKGDDSDDDGNNDIDFFDILCSISSKSNSINELNILDMTVYQVYRKFKRMQIIDQYDISIKSILAGAKDIKIKHWSAKI